MIKPSTQHIQPAKLARLVAVSRELNSKTNVDELLTHIIQQAAALTGAEAASILLLDRHTRQLHFKAASNDMDPAMADAIVPLDNSIAGAVLRANEPMPERVRHLDDAIHQQHGCAQEDGDDRQRHHIPGSAEHSRKQRRARLGHRFLFLFSHLYTSRCRHAGWGTSCSGRRHAPCPVQNPQSG